VKIGNGMEIPTGIQVVIGLARHIVVTTGYQAIGNAAVMAKDGYQAIGANKGEDIKPGIFSKDKSDIYNKAVSSKAEQLFYFIQSYQALQQRSPGCDLYKFYA